MFNLIDSPDLTTNSREKKSDVLRVFWQIIINLTSLVCFCGFFCQKIGLVFYQICANSRYIAGSGEQDNKPEGKRTWRILVRNVDFLHFQPSFFIWSKKICLRSIWSLFPDLYSGFLQLAKTSLGKLPLLSHYRSKASNFLVYP